MTTHTTAHQPPAVLAEVADGRWYSCMTPELEALRDTARQACWRHTTMDPALRGPTQNRLEPIHIRSDNRAACVTKFTFTDQQ